MAESGAALMVVQGSRSPLERHLAHLSGDNVKSNFYRRTGTQFPVTRSGWRRPPSPSKSRSTGLMTPPQRSTPTRTASPTAIPLVHVYVKYHLIDIQILKACYARSTILGQNVHLCADGDANSTKAHHVI
eukprot:NODE_1678_length_875_cov_48.907990_g1318_i0.p1 GENE.NODE_1678_length_875_cov_48.907990_g1318_i0~~NODE_1678_length_875_cov_48.907990_g1318_i0.p1  ORF type:complete len:130 (+),score=13.02 NODE_1678_length_875_cov_48.907990_g1318_i0:163-552(+)